MKIAFTFTILLELCIVRAQPTLFDQGRWKSVKEVKAALPCCGATATILLLVSQKTTGYGGAGQPMRDVDLIILVGGKTAYRFTNANPPEKNGSRYFLDDSLDIRDVTGDGVPEVLFHSGTQGASGFHEIEHILRYDQSRETYLDITTEPLHNASRHAVRWLTARKQEFAIVADENFKPSTPLTGRCHYCPSPFRYDVYVWSNQRNTFVVFRRVCGKASYTTPVEALTGDWPLIQAAIGR